MALIAITKGMADGAEAIQANFEAIGVIGRGTNANGTYVKFADGTMICYNRVAKIGLNLTNTWGALYITPEIQTVFPARFFEQPVISVNIENPNGDGAFWMNAFTSADSFTGRFVRGTSITFNATMGWMATGRWK